MACWLRAPVNPWAVRIWSQHGSTPETAKTLVASASRGVALSLCRCHPAVRDSSVALADKLVSLSSCLHAAACEAAAVPDADGKILHVRVSESQDVNMLQHITAALPNMHTVSGVTMTMSAGMVHRALITLSAFVQRCADTGKAMHSFECSRLTLGCSSLDAEAAVQLAAALQPAYSSIASLHVGEYTHLLAATLPMGQLRNLRSFTVSELHAVVSCSRGGGYLGAFSSLLAACTNLTSIRLDGGSACFEPQRSTKTGDAEGFAHALKKLSKLKSIAMVESGSTTWCSMIMPHASCLTSLTSIKLEADEVEDSMMTSLRQLPKLQMLHLSARDSRWSSGYLAVLAELTTLRDLLLEGKGHWRRQKIAEGLSMLAALSKLSLGGAALCAQTWMPNGDQMQFGTAFGGSLGAMRSLCTLALADAKVAFMNEMRSAFRSLPALQHLRLRNCELNAAWATAASQVTTLHLLVCKHCTFASISVQKFPEFQSALVRWVWRNPQLTRLSLHSSLTQPHRDGADDTQWPFGRQLAAALATLLHLQEVDLSANRWDFDNTHAVVASTQHLPELRHIKLSARRFQHNTCDSSLQPDCEEMLSRQMPDIGTHLARCKWL